MIRISLDQEDFRTLINGGVVKKDEVEIILKDIGYFAMEEELDKAIENIT